MTSKQTLSANTQPQTHLKADADMTTPGREMQKGLASLFESQELTDFIITCGPHTFPVHKAIISAHSEYFRSACREGFKEGHNNAIDLKTSDTEPTCDDPEAVKHIVYYFYHLDYKAPKVEGYTPQAATDTEAAATPTPKSKSTSKTAATATSTTNNNKKRKLTSSASTNEPPPDPTKTPPSSNARPSPDGNMLLHAQIFATAVKYQIHGLRRISSEYFISALHSNASHPDLAEAAKVVYTTTAEDVRELRDAVVEVLHERRELLIGCEGLAEVARRINGLAWEVLVRGNGK
ncbi:Putative BTB/POZ domain-containing protein [Septoria linicola]|uniref:BTB/POZ domain-containing protein n=1 Tax=Septoria linicola TaxID=215465 RepID=A0A9Q9AU62_9PEZI|nr:Putative BTB/POZ domain-containing protein [Septoria linicola]